MYIDPYTHYTETFLLEEISATKIELIRFQLETCIISDFVSSVTFTQHPRVILDLCSANSVCSLMEMQNVKYPHSSITSA